MLTYLTLTYDHPPLPVYDLAVTVGSILSIAAIVGIVVLLERRRS